MWSRVRAFVFARNGKRVIAYWDVADKSTLVFARPFDGKSELAAEAKAYLETSASEEDIRAAFDAATIR